ncbi:Ectoine hydroxylase-related dioxygenase, phytanoyl-CoA dioxygenase (PhyH) family [Lentzea xinjiangensis]|uniref:Ectoine hydroxylase-related dioxygenase, phytanoyl-CoA dioxygenase (PhyH) family n=1 Tax=Lentzea xinjiangensis TaxID=402600 RepID=A0A1H9U420_9PSEU|nr:phytanoyl-CoA dioxygenase family protein [Lentzea xinjiangensis]SES03978.1 Ectoine hydroxylase-related dioxygenase, phytanoyl-CoA dioxygenase (PhyH) family [Lentzea xinjiangensis]
MDDGSVRTEFLINDQSAGYPLRVITAQVGAAEIDHLVRAGHLVLRGLLPAASVARLRERVRDLARAEEGRPGAEWVAHESIYLRGLLDKSEEFHQLLRLEPVLSIARTLLGPQVWIDLEARMHYPGTAGIAVPWHNHLPVIPDPLPVFFCYPHQLHCLIYLDRVSTDEGALLVLPGSHTRTDLRIPLGDRSDHAGQVELFFEPGDAVIVHGGLWHRTAPSTADAEHRTLLLLGHVPSWIRNDTGGRGVPAGEPLTAALARTGDAELRELLGEFHW